MYKRSVFIGGFNMPTSTIDNSNVNQVYTRTSDFIISKEITRNANSIIYDKNCIVNDTGVTTLPFFDFSILGVVTNKIITIRTIVITSNNGGTTKIKPLFIFYNSNTLTGSTLTDNSFFNPTYEETILKQIAIVEPLPTVLAIGNLTYHVIQNELIRIGKLDINNKLYFAMITDEGYIPKISEKFYITIKGYLS